MRKFEALEDKFGLDDGGVASFTFKVQVLKKGKVYEEHMRLEEYSDGKGQGKKLRRIPSGFVIDDNACWNEIGSKNFKKLFKEI